MHYKDLIVWQKAMDLTTEIYRLTKKLPKDELYVLTNQIRRAAISIPSNIAEGHGRQTKKEFVNFLYIANGSRCEVETQLNIAVNLKYITAEQAKPIYKQCLEIGRMLTKLIQPLTE